MPDFVMTLRPLPGSPAAATPNGTTYLVLNDEDQTTESPQRAVPAAQWVNTIAGQVPKRKDATGVSRGDVLVFIHGYNNTPEIVLARHRLLKKNLAYYGFAGTVVSFDWPSSDVALAYLPDRQEAKRTAFALVNDGIWLVARGQSGYCDINVHLLAHSTGAYVVQEAFDDADHHAAIASINWTVSQAAFISGDISSGSLTAGNSETESLYRHCVRLTNYSNAHDEVLQISNVKRVGVAPRVGRVGLPELTPPLALNVDCTAYYQEHVARTAGVLGQVAASHSWQFENMVFAYDLAQTLNGARDRSVITTRDTLGTNRFALRYPPPP